MIDEKNKQTAAPAKDTPAGPAAAAVEPELDLRTLAEQDGVGVAVGGFLERHRKGFLIGLAAVAVVLAGVAVGVAVRDNLAAKALSQVEALGSRYEAVRIYVSGETEGAADYQDDIAQLKADLTAFAPAHSGYASARAYALLGSLLADSKDWAGARSAWTSAAAAAGKSYLAPVALYNAAVAAEEAGDDAGAIELYTQVLEDGVVETFPAAARAQFAVGRLREAQGDTAAALTAYQALVGQWPDDEIWANLAQSRILRLEIGE